MNEKTLNYVNDLYNKIFRLKTGISELKTLIEGHVIEYTKFSNVKLTKEEMSMILARAEQTLKEMESEFESL